MTICATEGPLNSFCLHLPFVALTESLVRLLPGRRCSHSTRHNACASDASNQAKNVESVQSRARMFKKWFAELLIIQTAPTSETIAVTEDSRACSCWGTPHTSKWKRSAAGTQRGIVKPEWRAARRRAMADALESVRHAGHATEGSVRSTSTEGQRPVRQESVLPSDVCSIHPGIVPQRRIQCGVRDAYGLAVHREDLPHRETMTPTATFASILLPTNVTAP